MKLYYVNDFKYFSLFKAPWATSLFYVILTSVADKENLQTWAYFQKSHYDQTKVSSVASD